LALGKNPMAKAKQTKLKPENRRHYFFLNSYNDAAFTKCPKCETKTKVRKFPLVIHIEPQQLFVLNKKCRYCTSCDLIIARKSEVESFMAACFEERNLEIIGNKYLVIGTLEKHDWRSRGRILKESGDTIERMYVFKDLWDFKPISPVWHTVKK
jgi:hypothetical protein